MHIQYVYNLVVAALIHVEHHVHSHPFVYAAEGMCEDLFICLHVVAVIFDSCFAYARACPVLSIQVVDSVVVAVLIDVERHVHRWRRRRCGVVYML